MSPKSGDSKRGRGGSATTRRLAEYLDRIVSAATLAPAGESFASGLPCRRRPNRRRCEGWLDISRQDVPPLVRWRCPLCDDGGTIDGWKGGDADLSALAGVGDEPATLRLSGEEQRIGLKLDPPDAFYRAVFLRARRQGGGSEFHCEVPAADLELLARWIDEESKSPPSRTQERELDRLIVAFDRARRRAPLPGANDVMFHVINSIVANAQVPRPRPRRKKRRGPAHPVRVKAMLRHIQPPVWRRLVLPGGMTLAELHELLQVAFDWFGGHLHAFRTSDRRFGDPELLVDLDVEDESDVRVADVLAHKGARLTYEYDFGDGWGHDLVVEEVLSPDESAPRCLGGRRAAPPEDCGGPPGYDRLREILANPRDPEHEELSKWAPENFDPERFDRDDLDVALQRFRRD